MSIHILVAPMDLSMCFLGMQTLTLLVLFIILAKYLPKLIQQAVKSIFALRENIIGILRIVILIICESKVMLQWIVDNGILPMVLGLCLVPVLILYC